MKKLLVTTLFLFAFVARAEWVATPFGPAWVGPNRPVDPPKPPTPPKPAPFVPSFEQGVVIAINVNGRILTSKVNDAYFATQAAADALCKKLLCLAVVSEPMFTYGPYSCSADQRFLLWADGLKENAGVLADYYRRNPEAQFPGLADWYVNGILKAARDNLTLTDTRARIFHWRPTYGWIDTKSFI